MEGNDMSEKRAQETVRVWDIVSTFIGEDGETKTEFHEYGIDRDFPVSVVEYGGYWDYGNGFLCVHAEDGLPIRQVCEISDCWDIGDKFDECAYDLTVGEWAEWKSGNGKLTIRVTRLSELPKISVEKTVKYSDLSYAQMNRVKVYGKPLFSEGDVEDDGVSCLRPNIANEINAIWTEYVCARCDGEISVTVDERHLNKIEKSVTVVAPNKDILFNALHVLGVTEPDKVKIIWTVGDGDSIRRISAKIVLSSSVN